MKHRIGCALLWTSLAIAFAGAAGAAQAGFPANPFKKYQPEVVVSDPYIEMHTGPGRGYPIFYVAGQGDHITLLKRKTDWFKVRLPRGSFDTKEGWVHVDQLRHTLDLDGNPLVIPKTGKEAFAARRWDFGLGGGDIDGAATINASLGFNLNPYVGVQAEAAQILGEYSDGYMGSVSIVMRPFPRSRISPFFNIGTGYLHVSPQTTIVQAEDLNDEIVHAGVGADVYISRKFMLRLEYRRHTVLTSRDDNEELNQWKAGFSIFF
ncbi:MAG TPA: outer membrane beta-barrel protein [Pseudomonadales bacterium]